MTRNQIDENTNLTPPTTMSPFVVALLVTLSAAFCQLSKGDLLCDNNILSVAPLSEDGVFQDVKLLNPHSYGPADNEFFAQDWVYDGLVAYGARGTIIPTLAVNWSIVAYGGGQRVTFYLRDGVQFSDGSEFNATVVVRNFDNVLSPSLVATKHDWYELPSQIIAWRALDRLTFQLDTRQSYYPLLQELTYIRPLRFAALTVFPPAEENTCPPDWNSNPAITVTCGGLKAPVGTGPWMLGSRIRDPITNAITMVTFNPNPYYWGVKPTISQIQLPVYPSSSAIAQALSNGKLNLAYGVLAAGDYINLTTQATSSAQFSWGSSAPLTTIVVAISTINGHLSDVNVRRAVQQSINKRQIIKDQFYDLQLVAETTYSTSVPYCDVDPVLAPLPDYDLDKVNLLMTRAGYTVTNNMWTNAAGSTVNLTVPYLASDPSASIYAPLICQYLNAAFFPTLCIPYADGTSYYGTTSAGNFSLALTETWGPPYDPHSFTYSWLSNDDGEQIALSGLVSPSQSVFNSMIDTILEAPDSSRQAQWTSILTVAHNAAIYLPLSYRTNQAVWSKSLSGVTFGQQEYDIPTSYLRCTPSPSTAPTVSSSSSSFPIWGIAVLTVSLVLLCLCCTAALIVISFERKSGRAAFAANSLTTPLTAPQTELSPTSRETTEPI